MTKINKFQNKISLINRIFKIQTNYKNKIRVKKMNRIYKIKKHKKINMKMKMKIYLNEFNINDIFLDINFID